MNPLLLLLLGLLVLLLGVLRRRKRRDGEPPLIRGWIPYVGKALQFGKDAHKFLKEHQKKYGDVFTVHMAGKYMTFIMDPLMYPSVIKQGRQLDFHEFTNRVAPPTFGYPPLDHDRFPGLKEQIKRSFNLLQGDELDPLTESMMGNLMLLFRQDHLGGGGWRNACMFRFCFSIMFEATFLTVYGRPPSAQRHTGMEALVDDFIEFDTMFPLLIAQVPVWLLGRTAAVRRKLIGRFLPSQTVAWTNGSQFIRTRSELFEQYDSLTDVDKAAHHFAVLWASVGNTAPATFWATYHLVSHPEALEKVRQEIHGVLELDGVDQDVALSREQLDRLVYLESSINESLRLSSASTNIRVAQEDFSLRLDGERSVSVRRGDVIALYPQSMHLDPQVYHEPQVALQEA